MPETQMLINYAPGDECRVAILEDGKLEEYYAEPTEHVSRVNNIYVGRVANVEPAIQAAFVDFGIGENGFLHISDLHPMYFAGDDGDATERVGKKTPRRDRPPIQECLRRGDEITVQVLKEGVGTKGPTLTSYLSIPGRYLVMMPNMDRVGVSRKVEDEDLRRRMREILDQLELPEGFGFILRTAGLDRNKTELKRDLAYLQRLWKDMEKRRKTGSRPRLLYSESDLLVRVIRDQLSADINQIVIDHPYALRRAARFMKIVSPRAQAKLMHYTGRQPMFHAYGVEPQILTMHAREVPLPGGGRLVIDETEALVAIDVNSGRMRDARDAETNAYRTNVEAVDEICRQLRLRDLGGIIINDLIDMRDIRRRREIEQRFKDRLKRDRSRTTVGSISEFGILEMTRQRMRGSHERQHFAECHVCRGRGVIQKAASVVSDGLRELALLLSYERIARVEMVVGPRVAGALLSSKRNLLSRIERSSGKVVEVRVSESVPIDRVSFYAYEAGGADIAIDRLPEITGKPQIEPWVADPADLADEELVELEPLPDLDAPEPDLPDEPLPGETIETSEESQDASQSEEASRRRRRRRRRGGAAQPSAQAQPSGEKPLPAPSTAPPKSEAAQPAAEGEPGDKKRRRRRRRRKGAPGAPEAAPAAGSSTEAHAEAPAPEAPPAEPTSSETASTHTDERPGRRRRRRRGGGRTSEAHPADHTQNGTAQPVSAPPQQPPAMPPGSRDTSGEAKSPEADRRPRRRGRGGKPAPAEARTPATPKAPPAPKTSTPPKAPQPPSTGPAPKPVRSLYASRRKLAPSERKRLPPERP
ncbi:MAG: Rne/Rng family ribonuclease [Phycisphaeraceae bacterium]|nr:Rne/Rng family ribonuclease [Phycisphaeraceae bacterium]